jgi:outer membrane protein assembly factor BamB
VAGPLFVDRDRLYFSLKDGTFHCLRLASKKRLWTIKTGGYLASLPAADDQRIFFVTSNNVLFCLNKKSGNLDWWRVISSRAAFSPAIRDEQVFVASRSPILVALKKNGDPAGTYDAGGALSSAPHCFGENLLINAYNPETAKGALIFIKGAASQAKKK